MSKHFLCWKTATMVEQACPEFIAFQRNYDVLLNLKHSIESVSSKAFADELIGRDLRIKCENKNFESEERTKSLLDFVEGKIINQPETLQKFINVLTKVGGHGDIIDSLLRSLEKAKEELETKKVVASQGDSTRLYREIGSSTVTINPTHNSFNPFKASKEATGWVIVFSTPPPTPTQERAVINKK